MATDVRPNAFDLQAASFHAARAAHDPLMLEAQNVMAAQLESLIARCDALEDEIVASQACDECDHAPVLRQMALMGSIQCRGTEFEATEETMARARTFLEFLQGHEEG